MRKPILISLLAVFVLGSALAIQGSYSRDEPPPGVAPDSWREVSNGLGMVIHKDGSGQYAGYFVSRVGDQWKPVTVYNPSQSGVLPAR